MRILSGGRSAGKVRGEYTRSTHRNKAGERATPRENCRPQSEPIYRTRRIALLFCNVGLLDRMRKEDIRDADDLTGDEVGDPALTPRLPSYITCIYCFCHKPTSD